MSNTPNFRLDGLTPADESSAEAEGDIELWDDLFSALAEHHTPDGKQSFFVIHDGSATWGIPGAPQLIALHVTRDLTARTFRIEQADHPTVPFAQLWLAGRGCPPDALQLPEDQHVEPADALTVRIEGQIRHSGARYEIKDHYTHDSVPYETWVMVRDSDPSAADLPVRIFLEEADLDAFTYTLREGAFRDGTSASQWLFDRDTPLPEPSEHLISADRRTRAALARSATGRPATVASVPAPPLGPAPSPHAQSHRRGGRS
ncbi:glycosyl hydrolase [Streptomyces sp. MNU76]|uniref:glycosyl hydrolase n=1 Tax=Streptomyces sp. MNU76 TaxID=2560026 RepID=UPI001E53A0A2|nr:glycosyl hydrolase [Streptomyces sp. MNU76]MCC9707114.1 glycosyl hydrolase [Streptomyces sp. MNU76]